MGTPDFAVPILSTLIQNDYEPILVITQPDKPKGRKLVTLPSPVKDIALGAGIEVFQPVLINSEESVRCIREIQPELIITAAYGSFIKKEIRDIAKLGCYNIHPSLLPQYRGATPVQAALYNGDKETGISIFKMIKRMDAGPILLQKQITIDDDDNATSLLKKTSLESAKMILKAIKMIEKEDIELIEQDELKATFCNKIEKEDLTINWNSDHKDIYNKIRALALEPGANTTINNKRIKVFTTEFTNQRSELLPGQIENVINNVGIVVATKTESILIKEIQPDGKKQMSMHAYNLGAKLKRGDTFA